MFYTMRSSSKVVEQNHLKFSLESLKELVLHGFQCCEFLPKGVTLAGLQSSMSRHEDKKGCNSEPRCPIWVKLQWLDKHPALNTLICMKSLKVRAPPTGM